MTGVELYIKDKNGNFYCYKQRHDGYFITDFVERIGKSILFCMSAKEIIKEFHDKFFKEYSEDNFHSNGSPLEYGVEIPAKAIKNKEFFFELNPESYKNSIYGDIENYIRKHYYDVKNDDNDYTCGYGDYIVLIDLNTSTIMGIDEDEEVDEDNDNNDDDFNNMWNYPNNIN